MRRATCAVHRRGLLGLAALWLVGVGASHPAEAKAGTWLAQLRRPAGAAQVDKLAEAWPWRGVRGLADACQQHDPAPLRLFTYWRTESGRAVRDAHAYLHPNGQQAAVPGRSVTLQEGLFTWFDRRWHYYDPLPCHGPDAF